MGRKTLFLLGLLVLFFSTVAIALEVALADAFLRSQVSIFPINIAAAVLSTLDLLWLLALFLLAIDASTYTPKSSSHRTRSRQITHTITPIILIITSKSITLASLVCIQDGPPGVDKTFLDGNIWKYVEAGYALWAVNVLAELSFFVYLTPSQYNPFRNIVNSSDALVMVSEVKRDGSNSTESTSTSQAKDNATLEKTIEVSPPSSLSSYKNTPAASLSDMPPKSLPPPRTSFLEPFLFAARMARHNVGLEEGPRPGVPKKTPERYRARMPKGARLLKPVPKKTSSKLRRIQRPLSPIPGSRPGSISDMLNIAALDETQTSGHQEQQTVKTSIPLQKDALVRVEPYLPPSHTQRETAIDTRLSTRCEPEHRRQSLRIASQKNLPVLPPAVLPSFTRRTDESHIHPLFRSDNLLPPPSRSPSTTVTASMFSGEVSPSVSSFPTRRQSASSSIYSSRSSRPTTPLDAINFPFGMPLGPGLKDRPVSLHSYTRGTYASRSATSVTSQDSDFRRWDPSKVQPMLHSRTQSTDTAQSGQSGAAGISRSSTASPYRRSRSSTPASASRTPSTGSRNSSRLNVNMSHTDSPKPKAPAATLSVPAMGMGIPIARAGYAQSKRLSDPLALSANGATRRYSALPSSASSSPTRGNYRRSTQALMTGKQTGMNQSNGQLDQRVPRLRLSYDPSYRSSLGSEKLNYKPTNAQQDIRPAPSILRSNVPNSDGITALSSSSRLASGTVPASQAKQGARVSVQKTQDQNEQQAKRRRVSFTKSTKSGSS